MAKNELTERVKYLTGELSGDHVDDAWHSLVELGPAALPHVVNAFEAQPKRSVAVALIRVLSEYRTRDALPFFTTLLGSAECEIWKTALDGIVAMGDESAIALLREISEALGTEKRSWVEEAISQIKKGRRLKSR
jgi:HEAT repeat protein